MSNPAINFTHMVMQIGQFIDHDFALAPLMPDPGEIINLGNPNNVIDCCSPSTRNMSECFSIDIPSGDPFFARFNQTCINMPRRIVEATFQHIVYSEWLPVIMGPAEMARYQLVLLRTGFTRYNDSVEATMMNEFAAAGFRLGHTLIDGSFNMYVGEL
ncbi:hypothetical protein IscW_ISCW006863, partial [Ixodes scapularis]